MVQINKPTDGEFGYSAFYNGKQAEVWASSSLRARDLAAAHFKASKRSAHMVHVVLAEKRGKPVIHTPAE